jgi:hypothetical protein
MELYSHNNLWYGIPLYVEYEYYDEEDSGTTTQRTARRSKRTAPVCRGKKIKLQSSKETSRRTTRRQTKVVRYTPLEHLQA